jgi:hypothetical protein
MNSIQNSREPFAILPNKESISSNNIPNLHQYQQHSHCQNQNIWLCHESGLPLASIAFHAKHYQKELWYQF